MRVDSRGGIGGTYHYFPSGRCVLVTEGLHKEVRSSGPSFRHFTGLNVILHPRFVESSAQTAKGITAESLPLAVAEVVPQRYLRLGEAKLQRL